MSYEEGIKKRLKVRKNINYNEPAFQGSMSRKKLLLDIGNQEHDKVIKRYKRYKGEKEGSYIPKFNKMYQEGKYNLIRSLLLKL